MSVMNVAVVSKKADKVYAAAAAFRDAFGEFAASMTDIDVRKNDLAEFQAALDRVWSAHRISFLTLVAIAGSEEAIMRSRRATRWFDANQEALSEWALVVMRDQEEQRESLVATNADPEPTEPEIKPKRRYRRRRKINANAKAKPGIRKRKVKKA